MLNERLLHYPFKWAFRTSVAVVVPVALAVVASVAGVAGQKEPPWVAKDWTKWTSTDCLEVLNASPWVIVKHYRGLPKSNAEPVFGTYMIQLCSALPIRQALLRQEQLESHYDKMDTQQRAKFDQIHSTESSAGDSGPIVIDVGSVTDEPEPPEGSGRRDVVRGPDPPTELAVKLANGSLILPTRVTLLKKELFSVETEYVFPRQLDGKSLFGPEDGVIWIARGFTLRVPKGKPPIQLQQKGFGALGHPMSLDEPWYTFPFNRLVYKGKLEY